jgi:hypothetical protein
MNEQHNELMKYVLDEPEEAAREIADLRYAWKVDVMIVVSTFLIGVLVGGLSF